MDSQPSTECLDEEELSHLYMWLCFDIPYCGCGWPNAVAQLIVAIVDDIASNSTWETIKSHTGGSDAATQLIIGAIEEGGLISHGTSLTTPWVTARGSWVRRSFHKASFEELEIAGLPHDGKECPSACVLGQLSDESIEREDYSTRRGST